MYPATLHDIGVISKLYLVIFAAFKESLTLNLAHRLFKVIHYGGNWKPAYDFNRFGDIAGFVRPKPIV